MQQKYIDHDPLNASIFRSVRTVNKQPYKFAAHSCHVPFQTTMFHLQDFKKIRTAAMFVIPNMLSRIWGVTIDGAWIGEWIY
jgi:hypothetical protein